MGPRKFKYKKTEANRNTVLVDVVAIERAFGKPAIRRRDRYMSLAASWVCMMSMLMLLRNEILRCGRTLVR